MEKEAVSKIAELAKATIFDIGEHKYSDKKLHRIDPPGASPLTTMTLTAIVDYCKNHVADFAGTNGDDPVIHVAAPDKVNVHGKLDSVHRSRECFLVSQVNHEIFKFGQEYDSERFIVALQSLFVQDETTAAIMKLVGNIQHESSIKVEDDGVTQRATARTGLAKVEEVAVPNPVTLRPLRTFPEIDQPESKFVLRMKGDRGNFYCSLHEADGGTWSSKAVIGIKAFLEGKLDETAKIIA